MPFPTDIPDNEWNQDNLPLWHDPQATDLVGIQLLPLEAKALHVIGTLVQIFNSAGYVLYCGARERPYTDYYLYAYLLACTAIELLGRCQTGEQNITRSTLRNLAGHGQAVASVGGQRQDVILIVELLDTFPEKLAVAFNSFYKDLFETSNPDMRSRLAVAAVEPILYSDESGQVYVSPLKYAYEHIYQPGRKPSDVLVHTDWQVYNPERDRRL